MVTKERLQELIRLCETIYTPDKMWGTIGNIKLNKDFNINNNRLQARIEYKDMQNAIGYMNVPLEELYEKKEDAEFIVKMHTQRPEFFEPPIWEEFEKAPKFSFWVNKFDGLGGLYCIEKTTDVVFDEYWNEIEKEYLDIYATLIENHKTGSGYFYRRDYTKDNYIKACEYARNLFLGKENENETNSDR